jgi:thiamine biosynthesis lipoprotein
MSVDAARWRAIGTNVDLLVNNADSEPARARAQEIIDRADASFSRFRADSELSIIQRNPGRKVEVSEMLGRAIDAALRAAELTDGLVDPTVGRVVRLSGYDRDFSLMSGATSAPHFEVVPGWRAIEWHSVERRLRLPRGVELDFGSTGKALVVDLAAQALLADLPAGAGALLSIGGDMRVVGTPPRSGWHVLLAEDSGMPHTSGGPVVAIHGGAMATSSTTVRRWRSHAEVVHHLIDPRTARPADGPWRTASVVAADCVDANTAATAAIILGATAADWLTRQHLAARLVSKTGALAYVGGWPEQGLVAA